VTDAIILFSHGSLLCGAGETLAALAERMRACGDGVVIEVGYLNYSEPTFESAFERCVSAGATRIVIAPYFLVAGRFVRVDLPRKIAAARRQYPQIDVQVAEAMRFHPLLADALLACSERAVPVGQWRERLQEVREFCRAEASCPVYGSALCRVGQQETAA
jgi:sirohydrochlorin cobaltochelatase